MPLDFNILLNHNLAQLGRIGPELMVVTTFLLALLFDLVLADLILQRRRRQGRRRGNVRRLE